ncbi:MAG TPA: class I lanthipeptide [Thermoanaerobaculia bacterium]|jgi:hypothetical protein|nr:class I lanthipeptide [Thermoanaerobaculia bacterium]
MKKKHVAKKLSIKKETLRHLNPMQLNEAVGGVTYTSDSSNCCCGPYTIGSAGTCPRPCPV